MTDLRSWLRVLFGRPLGAADLRTIWRRLTASKEFEDTVDDFAPTRLVSRADEMIDGPSGYVGQGVEVSEQDLQTLPAELQNAFKKPSRSDP